MSKEKLLEHANKLKARIDKAHIYMDALYGRDDLSKEEFEKGIKEREKHIPLLLELIKEYEQCMKLLKKH